MSKTKVIEIFERTQMVVQIGTDTKGRVVTATHSADELRTLNSDYINEHFGSLQDDAYKRGLEDGKWKSEDGCTGCKYEGDTSEHLPCDYCMNNFKNQWTAKSDKIEVGDEVKHKSESVTWTAVVTRIMCGTLTLMEHSGASADNYPIEDFVKTGRHFDIASILEDMRHD